MAIIVRNIGMDPIAAANALVANAQAQSTSAVGTSFFHADSTSNGRTPDLGFNVPQLPGAGYTDPNSISNPGASYGAYITQSAAVDLLSGQQLAVAICGALIGSGQTSDPPAHFYDAPNSVPAPLSGAGAHKKVDDTNTALLGAYQTFQAAGGIGSATQTASNTFANAIQTFYNAHRTQANVHYVNDGTNTSGAAAATTLNTFITLVNDLLNRVNNHVAGANPKYPQVRIISP